MNIVIHTFDEAPQERKDNVQVLKTALSGNAHIYVGGTSACTNWVNILETYKNDSLLLLEDDVRLCNDFLTKVEDTITAYPGLVLNFHFNENQGKTSKIPSKRYAWNQCVYFPKEVVANLIEPSKDFIKHYSYFVKKNDYAIQIRHALLKSNNKEFMTIEPKLVKSLGFSSTIGDYKVVTRNFIDDNE